MRFPQADHLAKNLAALDRVAPELAGRIRLPVGSGHTREDGGRVLYRLQRSWIPLTLERASCDRCVEAASGAPGFLLLGIGAGELVERFLACRRPLVAWEHDPWLLRLFLARHDVSAALVSGRLRLLLGTDLLDLREPHLAEVRHPVLGAVYANEIASRASDAARERAVLCDGGLFVEEVRRGLVGRGFATWTLDLLRLSHEELDRAMRRFAPSLVLAVNYVEGLAEFCRDHGARLVVWEVDACTTRPRTPACSTDHVRLFTYRRAQVGAWRAAGFTHVEHLPLAADPELRRPLERTQAERSRWHAPLAHVGSSMVENARACRERLLEHWAAWRGAGVRPADLAPVLAGLLAEQRRDFARFRVPELLEALAPGMRTAVLSEPGAEDPAVLAGEIAASEKRLNWAARLAMSGLAVWGDAGWRAVVPRGVDYRGPAGHREELTCIYDACPLHWDVGRIYQPDIVTMRVFDVLACGRPVLTEHNAELEELFDVGAEVESYRDPRELIAKVARLRADPARARELGRRGRAAIEERHSIEHRLAHLLAT